MTKLEIPFNEWESLFWNVLQKGKYAHDPRPMPFNEQDILDYYDNGFHYEIAAHDFYEGL